jgi:putative ATP-dependent endonuclease of OLD family
MAEVYHISSKPGKAKAIAQHYTEIPDFIVQLKSRLELIEALGQS